MCTLDKKERKKKKLDFPGHAFYCLHLALQSCQDHIRLSHSIEVLLRFVFESAF